MFNYDQIVLNPIIPRRSFFFYFTPKSLERIKKADTKARAVLFCSSLNFKLTNTYKKVETFASCAITIREIPSSQVKNAIFYTYILTVQRHIFIKNTSVIMES